MVLPYSNTGRTIVLYVVRSVSFCKPQVVAVRALRILIAFFAFSLVILVCSEKEKLRRGNIINDCLCCEMC